MTAAFSGRQVTTVWLLHQLGRAYATQEGLTPEQAWELSDLRQRAELFNPVETQINPNQVNDAVAKWERLAGREGACVAVTRPAAPMDRPGSAGNRAARPRAATARSAPSRAVPAGLVPAAHVAPAFPRAWALLRDHIPFDHGLAAKFIDFRPRLPAAPGA